MFILTSLSCLYSVDETTTDSCKALYLFMTNLACLCGVLTLLVVCRALVQLFLRGLTSNAWDLWIRGCNWLWEVDLSQLETADSAGVLCHRRGTSLSPQPTFCLIFSSLSTSASFLHNLFCLSLFCSAHVFHSPSLISHLSLTGSVSVINSYFSGAGFRLAAQIYIYMTNTGAWYEFSGLKKDNKIFSLS